MPTKETVRETLAKNIALHRKRNNMTQKQLAEAVGAAGVSTVSSWERAYNAPDIETLLKVCNVFEVSLQTIFGEISDAEIPHASLTPEAQYVGQLYDKADDHARAMVRLALEPFDESKKGAAGAKNDEKRAAG